MGRPESALGAGGRQGGDDHVQTGTRRQDDLRVYTEGKSEEGSYQESAVIGFDEATKMLSFSERRGGLVVTSKGDWSSPLGIQFNVDPIKVKDRTLQLRRTITVISAYSFSVKEELSGRWRAVCQTRPGSLQQSELRRTQVQGE